MTHFMLNRALLLVAKPFIGSGISSRVPGLAALVRRLYNRPGSVTTAALPLGIQLTVPQDAGLGLFLASTGKYEPLETKIVLDLVKPGMTVYDLGANIGYYTTLLGKAVGKKGRIYAFEPSKSNCSLLENNLRTNRLSNCRIVRAAASNGNSSMMLDVTGPSGEHTLIKNGNSKGHLVRTITIDSFAHKTGKVPQMVKIDVEGWENQALSGMAKTLRSRKLKVIFLEINAKSGDTKFPIQTLKNAGFKLRIIDEYRQLVLPFSLKEITTVLRKYGYVNLVAKRNI